ncbi:MAG: Transcriptional regulator [Myxococcaceae bacterium]|nr:Transcriptional regulator [Myxococcaceae bacterium]
MASRKSKQDLATQALRAGIRPTVAEAVGDELGAAEMNRHVSEALKRNRKLRELSLDQLAARSGVSRAALSQIEAGRTNPTLSVLWKIAVGLEIPFQELVELPEASNAKVLHATDSVVLRSADGRVQSRLISPGGSAGAELYELKLAPKGLLRSEPHGKGTTETVYVLKGPVHMNIGGTDYELATGDSIFFKADCPHEYENRGAHEARVLDAIHYDKRA